MWHSSHGEEIKNDSNKNEKLHACMYVWHGNTIQRSLKKGLMGPKVHSFVI